MTDRDDLGAALEAVARAMAPVLARAVVNELQAGTMPDHVDQHASPLGPRRHVAAIRAGKLAGAQVGRRWLARREDLHAFVVTLTTRKRTKALSPEAALAAELGIQLEVATRS